MVTYVPATILVVRIVLVGSADAMAYSTRAGNIKKNFHELGQNNVFFHQNLVDS